MADSSTTLGIGSGLARGLASVLLAKRQQDTENQRIAEQRNADLHMALLPEVLKRAQHYEDIAPFIDQIAGVDSGSGKKKGKKGEIDHHSVLQDLLGPLLEQNATPSASSASMDTASALTGGAAESSFGAAPAAASARDTLLGVPLKSDAELLQEQTAALTATETAKLNAQTDNKLAQAKRLRNLDPTMSLEDSLIAVGLKVPQDQFGTYASGGGVFNKSTGEITEPASAKVTADPVEVRQRTMEYQATHPGVDEATARTEALKAIDTDRLTDRAAKEAAARAQAAERDANLALKNHLLGADLKTDEIPLTATGDDVLKALKPADAAEVKQLAEYRLPVSTRSLSTNNPRMERIRGLVEQYTGGTWNAADYDVRRAAMIKFTSGPQADTVRKLNTTLGHLGTFADKALALNNTDIQLWNKAANAGKAQTGDPRIDGVLAAVEPVASDMVQLLRGTNSSEQDIKAWRERLSAAKSPAQYAEVLDTMAHVIKTQQEGLQHQWQTSMGETPFDLLSPGAEKAIARTDVVIRKLKGEPVGAPSQITVTWQGKPFTGTQAQIDAFKRAHPDAK